jgi:hypothetical protein
LGAVHLRIKDTRKPKRIRRTERRKVYNIKQVRYGGLSRKRGKLEGDRL